MAETPRETGNRSRTLVKDLILIRHAKSSWKESSLDDRERPLNRRGERDAPEMGARLARRRWRPDQIVSSPAVRALTTARMIAKKLDYARSDIVVEERLYGASVVELLDVIRKADESATRLMLFGHNPGLTELANHLGPREIPNLPTCGVLHLRFDADVWPVVGYARGVECAVRLSQELASASLHASQLPRHEFVKRAGYKGLIGHPFLARPLLERFQIVG